MPFLALLACFLFGEGQGGTGYDIPSDMGIEGVLRVAIRVANITDFSVEVRNSENDPYSSRFLYGVSKFSDFLRINFF